MNVEIRCQLCGQGSGKTDYSSIPDDWDVKEANNPESKFLMAYCPKHTRQKIQQHWKNFKSFINAQKTD